MTEALDRQVLERVDEDSLREGEGVERPSPSLVPRGGRRRRPTGEPPPLPREEWWRGVRWAVLGTLLGVASLVSFLYLDPSWVAGPDEALSRWVVARRTPLSIDVAQALDHLRDAGLVAALRWLTIVVLLASRRLRHLAVFIGALFLVEWAVEAMSLAIQRPRPFVEIIGEWQGFAHPSQPLAALTVTLLGAVRVLVPHGRPRRLTTALLGVLLLAVGTARVLLGIDHPADVLVAIGLASGAVFALTRLLVPNSRHPVVYRRGESAHLELNEERVDAIIRGVGDQLGLSVTAVESFGEVGSAGSTPLKLTIEDAGVPSAVFAKLYTDQHRRSDRLYKLGRLLLHGRLEDESSFATVRQLVQHEDHLTRLLRDGGVDVPDTCGIVEMTPEREYLVAFQMLDGHDLDPTAPMSDALADDCFRLVEQLWTAGVAHRDIKPGNVLVQGDTASLIDVAFAQVRPSPWRHAVDLGAMLMMVALAAGPERAYRIALQRFSADELAEALAAARGVAVPGQLRKLLEADDWAVRTALRELAPPREEIVVQRWDRRRMTAGAITLVASMAALLVAWAAFNTVGLL